MIRQSIAFAPLFLFSILPPSVFSAPYSERHSFCVDRTFHLYEYSAYDARKAYNSCMKRADQLIREYEESVRRTAIESERRMKRQREAERMTQQRNNSELNDVFGEFQILQME